MDHKSIKELEILHELSNNEHLTQRYLSNKLGMAAGLVNIYIRRLARKGYIKVTGMNHRRLRYLLTPRGMAEKTRLTYEFALTSYKYFKKATDDIRKKLGEIDQAGQGSVVVYGTGELAELCLLLIKELGLQVVAVIDESGERTRLLGYPVVPKDLLGSLKFDKIILATGDNHDEVKALLAKAGIAPSKACWLLEVSAG